MPTPANEKRQTLTRLREAIRSGNVSFAELIDNDAVRNYLSVGEALACIPKVTPERVGEICAEICTEPLTKVGDLNDAQRQILVDVAQMAMPK